MIPKITSGCSVLEIIEQQKEIIEKQNEMIAKLVNENIEQESIINELMKGYVDG